MPQTIVPASIAADKTKLYLDHQSKLILRTRYSARPTHTHVSTYRRQRGQTGSTSHPRKIKPTMSDDEKLMPDAGGTSSSPVKAIGK